MGRGNDKLTNFAEIKIRQFRVQTLGYQLVKFDGLTGEAFPRVEISISETGSPIAMDFAADGTLYMATYQGKIFTVDTASGKGTLLASAEIQITSLAIQPETGEIWASAKDVQSTEIRIFKINRETGDTLGIGNTGINQKIKDIKTPFLAVDSDSAA